MVILFGKNLLGKRWENYFKLDPREKDIDDLINELLIYTQFYWTFGPCYISSL
jgi:hypothetical protein